MARAVGTFSGLNPDEDLYEMALAAGVPIPKYIKQMSMNFSMGNVGTVTYECLIDDEFAKVYFAWLTSKRMKGNKDGY